MKRICILFAIIYSHSLSSQCFPDRHSTNWFDAWVSCEETTNPNPTNKKGHWILYDLIDNYKIDKIKIWNVNDPDHLNWGMKEIRIEYSADSLVWNVAEEIELLVGDGNNRYEGMDWIDVVIPKARFILISAMSTFGGTCAGLAEIRFSAEKIKINTDVVEENQTEQELSVSILPNPFSDIFKIEFRGNSISPINFQISDMLGSVLQSETTDLVQGFQTTKIFTRKWPAGSYVLSVRQENILRQMHLVKI